MVFGAASASLAKVVTPDGAAPFINHKCALLAWPSSGKLLRHLPVLPSLGASTLNTSFSQACPVREPALYPSPQQPLAGFFLARMRFHTQHHLAKDAGAYSA